MKTIAQDLLYDKSAQRPPVRPQPRDLASSNSTQSWYPDVSDWFLSVGNFFQLTKLQSAPKQTQFYSQSFLPISRHSIHLPCNNLFLLYSFVNILHKCLHHKCLYQHCLYIKEKRLLVFDYYSWMPHQSWEKKEIFTVLCYREESESMSKVLHQREEMSTVVHCIKESKECLQYWTIDKIL